MIKLLKYMKGTSVVFALLAPLAMFVEVIMDLLQPTLMSNIIDIGVANGDLHYVLTTGMQMLLVALLGAVAGMSCSIFSTIASIKMSQNLRGVLFQKIQTLSFIEIDKFKTSSLITRLTNDVTQVQNIVMMGLRGMVRAPLLCIGGMSMAFMLSPKLSVVLVIVIPIILLIVTLVLLKSFPLFRAMQDKIDQMNVVMRENLLGIRVIKAFTMENKQISRFAKANDDLMNTSIRAQNLTLVLMPLVTLIVNLSVVAVLWYGGNLAQIGGIETGKIMAFINYLTQILMSFMMVVMMVINFSRAKVSSDRINEVLFTTSSIQEQEDATKLEGYAVEFDHVSFKYHDHSEYVLKDISFKIKEGERVGIIGGTGSGKSSLIGLIPRLYDTTEGSVRVGGKDVRSIELEELRHNIGVVLQQSILFSGTIADNLKFGYPNATSEEMHSASEDAAALEFISNKEDGYDSTVEQRGKNLSGGQKQRLSIARTLIRNPKILILDDSTSALDMATESKLQQALKRRMSTSTVFIIAQRISGVMDADQIIVLDNGEISGIGTHKELLKTNEIYRSIAISQLGEEVVRNV